MNENAAENQEWKLLQPADLYQIVFRQVTDMVLVMDLDGRLIYSNSNDSRLYAAATLTDFYDCLSPEDQVHMHQTFMRVASGRSPEVISLQYQADEDCRLWFECHFMLHAIGGADSVIVSMKDITQRKQEEEALRRLAFQDPLTGLPNRRLFEEHLNHAIASSKRNRQLVAVFYMDVDDFKLINDRSGHETGDRFLVAFAKRIKSCIREIDTFARMGGDEFTILLPVVDSKGSVEKVARRVMNAARGGWEIDGVTLHTTISMGIAIYPQDGDRAELLLRNVDSALYEVKCGGRNGYQFYA